MAMFKLCYCDHNPPTYTHSHTHTLITYQFRKWHEINSYKFENLHWFRFAFWISTVLFFEIPFGVNVPMDNKKFCFFFHFIPNLMSIFTLIWISMLFGIHSFIFNSFFLCVFVTCNNLIRYLYIKTSHAIIFGHRCRLWIEFRFLYVHA